MITIESILEQIPYRGQGVQSGLIGGEGEVGEISYV